jgi:2-(acetamidomethylene)succinate hydrolase
MATLKHRSAPEVAFTKANGIRIRYHQWPGEEPTVLLLHNNRGASDAWTRFADISTLPNRLVAPDQRGCAESDKPATGYTYWDFAADVAGLIDDLDLGRVRVVGCALGAGIGLCLAANHPDKVEALVMLESSFPVSQEIVEWGVGLLKTIPQDFPSKAEAMAFVRTLPHQLGYSWSPVWEEYFGWTFRQLPEGRWAFKYDKAAMLQANSHTIDDLWPEVAKVTAPVLVAVGGASGFMKDSDARELAERLPNGEFTVLENMHHIPILEGDLRPIDEVVARFFATLLPARP